MTIDVAAVDNATNDDISELPADDLPVPPNRSRDFLEADGVTPTVALSLSSFELGEQLGGSENVQHAKFLSASPPQYQRALTAPSTSYIAALRSWKPRWIVLHTQH